MVQQSTVIRPEGNVITVRKYEMKDDQLHLRKSSSSQSHKIISSLSLTVCDITRYNSVGFWKSGMRSTIILKLLY